MKGEDYMGLFNFGKFLLHSGNVSNFKIDCDALSFRDWNSLAKMIADRVKFGKVIGIPRGGLPLSRELEKYISAGPRLVVDDVWTTGNSMKGYLKDGDIGFVVFARNPITVENVRCIFMMM